jgi:hypothetical protein
MFFQLVVWTLDVWSLEAKMNSNTLRIVVSAVLCGILSTFLIPSPAGAETYSDGRPAATMRLEAKDDGVVLRHGDGPEKCDLYGACDVWVFQDANTCYMLMPLVL